VRTIGPTAEVIRSYFDRAQERSIEENKSVRIIKVVTHDANGPRVAFSSGSRLWITVEVEAARRQEDMSLVIQIVDDRQYPVFDTCTQRLGGGPINIDRNQTLSCTFELTLSLAAGTFHVNVALHRYVTNKASDRWRSAATFFVTGAPEVGGIVTLHPRLVACDVISRCEQKMSAEPETRGAVLY
jgi:hypothetical protein